MVKKKKKEVVEEESKPPVSQALLEYFCEVKGDAIERLMVQVRRLRDKNNKFQERNARLKSEQLWHLKNVISELCDEQKQLASLPLVTREQVEDALKKKMAVYMRLQISSAEKRFLEKLGEREYWEEYKNVGSEVHAKQIGSLEDDISSVKENTKKMAEFYRASLEETKKRITNETLKQMIEKKELATQNAVKNIDKQSSREILENDWLKKEVEVHKKEVAELEATVHLLEEENLLLLSQLFNCKLVDLKIPRPLFLTQGAGLTHTEVSHEEVQPEPEPLEKKDSEQLTLSERLAFLYEDEEDKAEESESESFIEFGASDLHYLLCEDEKDFEEYTDLGPLEVKLMSLEGQKKPIHKSIEEVTKKEWEDAGKEGSVITYRMISSLK